MTPRRLNRLLAVTLTLVVILLMVGPGVAAGESYSLEEFPARVRKAIERSEQMNAPLPATGPIIDIVIGGGNGPDPSAPTAPPPPDKHVLAWCTWLGVRPEAVARCMKDLGPDRPRVKVELRPKRDARSKA